MRVKEFNNEVIFLHEITTGAANRSYGIHVAQIAGLPQKVISRAEEVLHNLENQNKGLSKDDLSQQLPLFTYAKESKPQTSKLHETLKDLNPDDLSPREALAKLYELKKLL
jgi:DNA mismatch repair protein MutS